MGVLLCTGVDCAGHAPIMHHPRPRLVLARVCSSSPWGSVSAPGTFFDPCPTGDLLGGALRGRT